MTFNIDEIVKKAQSNIAEAKQLIQQGLERKTFTIPESKGIFLLEGGFGKQFLEEYDGRIKDYKDNPNLKVLNYNSNIVKGSNPFAVVLANQILNQENLRTATQADLEKAVKIQALDLKETYQDTGLVLRSVQDTYTKNTPISRDLANQLKEREIQFSPENPVVIPLNGLRLKNADNEYGLSFNIKDDAEIYNAPILNSVDDSKFSSKNINPQTGLPTKVGQGNRTIWTRDSGLSRLCLYGGLNADSDYRGLNFSASGGSVVVVGDEAARVEGSLKLK